MRAHTMIVPCLGLAMAGLFFSGNASGATRTWSGLVNNNYSDPGNWSGLIAPISTDDASFPLMGAVDPVEFFTSPTIANVLVSGDYLFEARLADRTYTVTGDLDIFSGGDITIIEEGGAGTSSLTLDVAGTTTVNAGGELSASDGSFSTQSLFSNGSITFTGSSSLEVTGVGNHDIGTAGNTATIHMHGGSTASFAGTLRLGADTTAFSQGIYEIHGGSSAIFSNIVLGGAMGNATSGSLEIYESGSSAIMTGASTLNIGGAATTGTGSLLVTDDATFTTGTGAITIGETGSIIVNSGGTLNVRGATSLPGASALTLDGGTVTVDNTTFDFGTGSSFFFGGTAGTPSSFNVINGAETTYTYNWSIANSAGSQATTFVSGVIAGVPSTLRATGGGGGADVQVAQNGTGTLDVFDGGQVIAGDDLYVGRNTGAIGVMTVSGVHAGSGIRSTVSVTRNNSVNSNIYIGGGQSSTAGTGTVYIENGALVETSGSVYLGQNAGADGTVVLLTGSGDLDVAQGIYIGGTSSTNGGTGTLNIYGGQVTAGSSVKVWPGGEVDLDLAGRLTAPLVNVDGGLFELNTTGTPGSLRVPTVNVTNGGEFKWYQGTIATGMDTDVIIDGATSTLTDSGLVFGTPPMGMGTNGYTGSLTLQNSAQGNIRAAITLGNTGTGILNLLNNANLTTSGDINVSSGTSQVNVDLTSQLIQTDTASVNVSNGGQVNVANGSLFSTGTGTHTVNSLSVTTGGTFQSNGPMTLLGNTTLTGLGLLDVNDDLTLQGQLSAELGTELTLASNVTVELKGSGDLTLEGNTLVDNNNIIHLNSQTAQLTSTGDLTFGPLDELRLTNGTTTIPGTLTFQSVSRLKMDNSGISPGGTVTATNIDFQAGSNLFFDDGLIEVDGGVLTAGDTDFVVKGLGPSPVLRLTNGATTALAGSLDLGGFLTEGNLDVLSGSSLVASNIEIGPESTASGSLLVSGTNSSVISNSSITVGANLSGGSGGFGTLTITGSTASVDTPFVLEVGELGTGIVNTSGQLEFGDATVGSGVGGDGTINMTGGTITGDTGFLAFGSMYIGTTGGTGELTATSGSIQLEGVMSIGISGAVSPSDGTVTLDGSGVSLSAEDGINVGLDNINGNGTLELLDGSSASTLDDVRIGDNGVGNILMEDPFGTTASSLTVGTVLKVGANGGIGDLVIRDGSQVISPDGFVAAGVGSVGDVLLSKSTSSGAKSQWSGQRLYIGGDNLGPGGTGSVSVSSNSELAFTQVLKVWSGGTLGISGSSSEVAAPKIDRDSNQGTLNWSSGDITLTNSNLYVGTGTDTDFFLGQNATVPGNGSLTLSGETIVGDPLVTGAGTLNINGTLTTGVAENTLVESAGILNMTNGTLETSRLELRPGAVFAGSGTVDGRVLAIFGSTINVTGNLTMGDPNAIDGFIADAQLNIGANQVLLQSKGFINLGPLTTIAGGTLTGSKIALDTSDNIEGSGSVIGSISAGSGSFIEATGDLDLGFVNNHDGFYGNGVITIADSATVTLQDANDAVLDSGAFVQIGDTTSATLAAGNGLTLDFGANINGFGTVDTPDDPFKPFVNNGNLAGNSPAEPLTLTGYVKGVGTMDNVVITGTDAPGFSPATVYRGSVTYAGTLEMEIGGMSANDFDIINHAGTATLGGVLELSLINGFTPGIGDSFQIITANSLSGTFNSVTGTDLGGGLTIDVLYGLNDVTLEVISNTLPGDLDGDGFVGINDLNIVLANWNQTVPPANPLADPSGDGFVGIDDLNEVLSNWNAGVPPVNGSGSVPEPASLVLLELGAIALSVRRRLA